MAQNTKGLKGQGHTSRSSVKVTYLFYQTCAWYCGIRTRNLKMMLLLDFAVACVDCTGGNKKNPTETGSITILTESTSRSINIGHKHKIDRDGYLGL